MTLPVTAGWDCHVHVFDTSAPRQAGHYTPASRTLSEIEAIAGSQGVRHLVLVQPSVYGADNSLLLRSLAVEPGRHRGVVTLSHAEPQQTLEQWQAAGVRGVRYNLVSPVGNAIGNAQTWLNDWAPRLHALNWHVQFYAAPKHLVAIAELQKRCSLPFVLDHVAGMGVQHAHNSKARAALQQLADQGAWIKLSAHYRLGLAPEASLAELRLAELLADFRGRCLWGSDWPHTGLADADRPDYAALCKLWQADAALARDFGDFHEAARRLYV
jgi:predicted TIM-barrel fold metal-dependent hydrolase